jgi:hypothetical protein
MFTKPLHLVIILSAFGLFATSAIAQGDPKKVVLNPPKVPAPGELAGRIKIAKPNIVLRADAEKIKLANESLKNAGSETKVNSLTQTLTLTPSQPKLNDDTFLTYFKPWNVLAVEQSAQFSGSQSFLDSSLMVSFNPSSPGVYVFEMSIKRSLDTRFSVLLDSGNTVQTINSPRKDNGYTSIVVPVIVTKSGRQGIWMFGDRDWLLFSVKISRAN